MTVGELLAILQQLPKDMQVLMHTDHGQHITLVEGYSKEKCDLTAENYLHWEIVDQEAEDDIQQAAEEAAVLWGG